MILTRAPLRISYAGGGSDYASYFNNYGGNVVGVTIDQFAYCHMNTLSPISREKIRFNYRITESVERVESLKHPVLRETLKMFGIKSGLNIGTFSDLPSGTGLGGSSSFTVSLILGLNLHYKMGLTLKEISELAIKVERQLLGEVGGWQDQVHATFGGLRHYEFSKNNFTFGEKIIGDEYLEYLSRRHLLIWSGNSRNSKHYSALTESAIKHDYSAIKAASEIAVQLAKSLQNAGDSSTIFRLISDAVKDGWERKKDFSAPVSESVMEIIETLLRHEISAFKLLGAGHEGFILCLGEPEVLQRLRALFGATKCINPQLIGTGVEALVNV